MSGSPPTPDVQAAELYATIYHHGLDALRTIKEPFQVRETLLAALQAFARSETREYYCGPCDWNGMLPKPQSGHPRCPDCEALLSEAPVQPDDKNVLPDCMMPDGADPCEGFKWLQTEAWIWRKRAEEAEAKLAQSAIREVTLPREAPLELINAIGAEMFAGYNPINRVMFERAEAVYKALWLNADHNAQMMGAETDRGAKRA